MASDKKFTGFTAAQWGEIDDIVRRLHPETDPETIMVSGLPTEAEVIPPATLRTKLEWMARLTVGLSDLFAILPTPKKMAMTLTEKLDQTEEYRRSFKTFLLDYGLKLPEDTDQSPNPVVKSPSFQQREALQDRLNAVLSDVANHLRDEIAHFGAVDSRSKENSSKFARNAYLEFVLDLWNDIGSDSDKALRKWTIDFLVACAKPMFPETTKKAADRWLDKHRAGSPDRDQ